MKTFAGTILAIAVALVGCGKPDQEGAGSPEPRSPTAADSAERSGAGEAVAAVLQSAGTPVAKLSFVVATRPVKGQPFTLQLLASATAPVPALQVTAASGSLEISPATAVLALDAAGVTASQDLTVTAQQEGLAELTVRLQSGAGEATVYAIPVLVMGAESTPADASAPAAIEKGG
jgi:hypothetical protein